MLLKNLVILAFLTISHIILAPVSHAAKKVHILRSKVHIRSTRKNSIDDFSQFNLDKLALISDSDDEDSDDGFNFVKLQAFKKKSFKRARKGNVNYFQELQKMYSHDSNGLKNFLNSKSKRSGKTVLEIATKQGHLELIVFFVFACKAFSLDEAITLSAQYGKTNVVMHLLSKSQDLNRDFNSALISACEYGHLDLFKTLLNNRPTQLISCRYPLRLAKQSLEKMGFVPKHSRRYIKKMNLEFIIRYLTIEKRLRQRKK